MRYFEDIEAGDETTFGEWTVSKDEIVEFARQWDPQPIHVDETAASQSIHGGLIASGLHTIGIAMRLWVDAFLADVANLGARYIKRVQFDEPVRPDDTLVVTGTVLDTTVPEHTDRHGYLDYELAAHVDGDEVMSMVSDLVVQRRDE